MAICVLTGDIVGSTKLTPAELFEVRQTMVTINKDLEPVAGPAHFDSYRGDGWQATFTARRQALRIALIFRAALRAQNEKYDTRIAIAIGSEGLDNIDISKARSPTFVSSGHALDEMPEDQFIAHASGGALGAATVLADHISRSWTQAQARAILPFIMSPIKPTQKDVAHALGISRQAVGQALDAASYTPLSRALRAIEEQAK